MGREFFICEDAAFVTPVCPRLVFGNAVPTHLVKYCIQPLRDRKFYGCSERHLQNFFKLCQKLRLIMLIKC